MLELLRGLNELEYVNVQCKLMWFIVLVIMFDGDLCYYLNLS